MQSAQESADRESRKIRRTIRKKKQKRDLMGAESGGVFRQPESIWAFCCSSAGASDEARKSLHKEMAAAASRNSSGFGPDFGGVHVIDRSLNISTNSLILSPNLNSA